ncbi:MAG: putative ABC transport system permease protein [Pseudohongiellaceae bacterium]|jgi:putative ABC transport system permease protein
MEFGPIFRALMRNKLGVVLIAVQIAFTMTVIINAVFIINERSRLMARPSGMDEANQFFLFSIGYGENFQEELTVQDDLAMLKALPGIVNASVVNSVPLSGSGSGTALQLTDDDSQPDIFAAIYRTDENVVDTMGLELIAGENFSPSDMRTRTQDQKTTATKTIITTSLAQELFPDDSINDAVGKTVYMPGSIPVQIIGVVEQLQAPWQDSFNVENSMIVPENVTDGFSIYLVRTEPGERDRLMADVEERLAASPHSRIIRELQSLEKTRIESYRIDNAMSTILWIIVATLIFITSMGIVGLAVFGINKRRKQIGTRRALGATQVDILRYFMLENLFVTLIGVSFGAVLTVGFSIALTTNFNMPTLSWYYIPTGMVALLFLGQLAVLGPSSGAARTQPAIATRAT